MKKELGELIKKARKSKKITQAEICKEIGISTVTMTQIENGTGNVGIDSYEALIEKFELEKSIKVKPF